MSGAPRLRCRFRAKRELFLSDGLPQDTLRVCETFVSIQGESTRAGTPCFFVRLAGCNLNCSYCDTRYATEGGEDRSIESLVEEFRMSGLRLVEVTGGEPLLQERTMDLLEGLLQCGVVMIETNGSIDISRIPDRVITIMDVKCPGSGESDAMDLKNLDRLRSQDEIKFVISNRADFDWAMRMVELSRLPEKCHAVLLSAAEGVLAPRELADWMIRERVPARLNLQLHKLLWGGARRK